MCLLCFTGTFSFQGKHICLRVYLLCLIYLSLFDYVTFGVSDFIFSMVFSGLGQEELSLKGLLCSTIPYEPT